MQSNFKQLQKRLKANGQPFSVDEIARLTGISTTTLDKIATGKLIQWSDRHIDALCAVFGCTAGELLQAEPVALPLPPARPDRKGIRIGEPGRGRGKT